MGSNIKLPAPFKGIITPMVTPLTGSNALDKEGLFRLTEHIINGGVQALFILGTTGESTSLSYTLKQELIIRTCENVNGRIPVFVGITDCSPQESILLTNAAEKAGASAVVAAPPFYFGLDQQELTDYFRNLADKLVLPLFLYNIPSLTKTVIEASTVKALASHPNIIGLKDSSGSAPYFNSLLHHMQEDKTFTLLVGPDEMMASAVLMGGHGGVNSGSNLFPHLFTDLYHAAETRNLDEVLALQGMVMEISAKIYNVGKSGSGFLKGLKAALSLLEICDAQTASPLGMLGEKEFEAIETSLILMCKNSYLNKVIP